MRLSWLFVPRLLIESLRHRLLRYYRGDARSRRADAQSGRLAFVPSDRHARGGNTAVAFAVSSRDRFVRVVGASPDANVDAKHFLDGIPARPLPASTLMAPRSCVDTAAGERVRGLRAGVTFSTPAASGESADVRASVPSEPPKKACGVRFAPGESRQMINRKYHQRAEHKSIINGQSPRASLTGRAQYYRQPADPDGAAPGVTQRQARERARREQEALFSLRLVQVRHRPDPRDTAIQWLTAKDPRTSKIQNAARNRNQPSAAESSTATS